MISFVGSPTHDHRAREAEDTGEVHSQPGKASPSPTVHSGNISPSTLGHDSPSPMNFIQQRLDASEASQQKDLLDRLSWIENCQLDMICLHLDTVEKLPSTDSTTRLGDFEASLRMMIGQLHLTLDGLHASKANSHVQAARLLDCNPLDLLCVAAEYDEEGSPRPTSPTWQRVRDSSAEGLLACSTLPVPCSPQYHAAGLTASEQRWTQTNITFGADYTFTSVVRSQSSDSSTFIEEWSDFNDLLDRFAQENSSSSTTEPMRSPISPLCRNSPRDDLEPQLRAKIDLEVST